MTKKDYNEFATLFGRYLEQLPNEFINDFMDILASDNIHFDRDRFFRWCVEVKDGKRDKFTGKRIA